MQTIKQVQQTLEESVSLKIVAQAYTEIAALKLQKIRSGIERNRSFFQEIITIFRTVKVAAERSKVHEAAKAKGTVSILLTSNERFYGDLETRLTRFFAENSQKFKTDRIVIGSTANEYLKAIHFPAAYQLFIPSGDLPPLEEMQALTQSLTDYQQILVYYSRMQSILMQEPTVVDLLQRPPERLLTSKQGTFEFIFEPEIENILEFFNNQMTLILLEQTFLESELARTASRLISMDRAQGNADEFILRQKRLLSQARRSTENIRLLETIASTTLWRKDRNAL